MKNAFFIIFLLSGIGLITGLINPKIVIFWTGKGTRKKAVFIYGLFFLISILMIGAFSPSPEEGKSKDTGLSNSAVSSDSTSFSTDIASHEIESQRLSLLRNYYGETIKLFDELESRIPGKPEMMWIGEWSKKRAALEEQYNEYFLNVQASDSPLSDADYDAWFSIGTALIELGIMKDSWLESNGPTGQISPSGSLADHKAKFDSEIGRIENYLQSRK